MKEQLNKIEIRSLSQFKTLVKNKSFKSSQSVLIGFNISKLNVSKGDLISISMKDMHIANAKFVKVSFHHATFTNVVFENCIFSDVDFSLTIQRNTIYRKSVIQSSIFTGSHLQNCQFVDCKSSSLPDKKPFLSHLLSFQKLLTPEDLEKFKKYQKKIQTNLAPPVKKPFPTLPKAINSNAPSKIDFSRRNLTTLEGVLKFRHIVQKLDCDYNRFRTFAGFPREILGLRHLSVCKNQLSSFKGFPQSLPDLEGLYLENNKLSTLPALESIAPNLERLAISNNQICSLANLSDLSKLYFLLLDNNKLTSLEGLHPVLPLTCLHVSGNNLENFAGFPALPSELIPSDPRVLPPKIELEFYDNPLRSFHGVPRYFLPSAVRIFRIPTDFFYYRPEDERIRTIEDVNEHTKSFQFSSRGAELIKQCIALEQRCVKYPISILDIEDPYMWDLFDWFDHDTPRAASVYNLRTHRWETVTKTMWDATDDPLCPLTPEMRQKRQDYLEYPGDMGEQDRYWKPYPPEWYEAYDALYAYYQRSPMDLATSYTHDPTSLTEEELGRLMHEGSGPERDILLTQLPPTDPGVKSITTRLTVPLDSGYSILL